MVKDIELRDLDDKLMMLDKDGRVKLTNYPEALVRQHDWKMLVLMLILAISLKSWQPLAIANAKQEDGSFSFNKSVMVVMVELVKLCFCAGVLAIQLHNADPETRESMTDLSCLTSLHFLVPSVLYAASNTLVYYSMSFINPALFHVFGNIRIIVAGVLYRIIMKKKQSDLQWTALFLLMIGAALATPEFGELSKSEDEDENGGSTLTGLFFVVLMCLCSTSSSIYTEMFFKRTKNLSIFYQNTVLYLYGILVNLVILTVDDFGIYSRGLFTEWDSSAVQVLICQSMMGVSLSFIFKYLDNIVYVFSLTAAMVISIVLSILFFDFQVNSAFVFAVLVVSVAIYIYYRNKILEKYNVDPHTFEF